MSNPIKPKKKFSKECNRLRRMIALGMEHTQWTTVDDCAKTVKISPGTLDRHSRDKMQDKSIILASSKKVERYLRERGIAGVPRTRKYRDHTGPPKKALKRTGTPPQADAGVLLQILGTLQELAAKPAGERDDVIVSPIFDRILSGAFTLAGQEDKNIRFVLQAGTFRKLSGAVSAAEVNDTKLLIAELRRRLTLFAQLQDSPQRQQLFQGLASEINHLYVAIKQLEQVVPTDAGKHLAELDRARSLSHELFKKP